MLLHTFKCHLKRLKTVVKKKKGSTKFSVSVDILDNTELGVFRSFSANMVYPTGATNPRTQWHPKLH